MSPITRLLHTEVTINTTTVGHQDKDGLDSINLHSFKISAHILLLVTYQYKIKKLMR